MRKDRRDRRTKFEIFAEKNADGEIKIGKDRRYRWRLVASNGEPVAASEGYQNKRDLEQIIGRLKEITASASVIYLDGIVPSPNTNKYWNPLWGRIISSLEKLIDISRRI